MILFLIILVLEVSVNLKRSAKYDVQRLIVNVITLVISVIICMTLGNKIDLDVVDDLSGALAGIDYLDEEMINSIVCFVNETIAGITMAFASIAVFWICKGLSGAIMKATIKDKSEDKGVKGLRLVLGLIAGLTYAGFTVMPYTGILHMLPDNSVEKVIALSEATGFVSLEQSQIEMAQKITDSKVEKVTKYFGIGYVTELVWDKMVPTSDGVKTLLTIVDDVEPFVSESSNADKLSAASNMVRKLNESNILSEEQTVRLLNSVMSSMLLNGDSDSDLAGQLASKLEYDNVEDLAKDIEVVSDIVEKLEQSGISENTTNITVTKETVDEVVEDIYKLSKPEDYTIMILETMSGVSGLEIEGNSLAGKKEKVRNTLYTLCEMSEAKENNSMTLADISKFASSLDENRFLSEDSYTKLLKAMGLGL